MSDVLNIDWKISDDAVANPVGNEMVILHLENSNYYGLDPVGTVLWHGLISGKKPAEVCDDILSQFEAERARVEQDIARFLVDLEENDLISRA